MVTSRTLTKLTSSSLRIAAILFFRTFPGRMPTVIFTLFALYVPAFLTSYLNPELEVVDDEIDLTVKETTAKPDGAAEGEELVISEEVEVEEKITYSVRDYSPFNILSYGAPAAGRPFSSLLTFLINLALVGLTVDSLFRGSYLYPTNDLSFVRLGYVSSSEARFFIREPNQEQWPVTLQIRQKDDESVGDWKLAGVVDALASETDHSRVVLVPFTHSDQRKYEWQTSNNHSGEFTTAPAPGKMPTLNGGKFTFLSTSCILPNWPYNPLDHPYSIPGFRHLAKRLPELQAQFMLFLGDFIYIDVPQRFGKSENHYLEEYRTVYASPDWASVGQNLSWLHVFDDHEISNDYDLSNDTQLYKAAIKPWHIYQGMTNPPKAITAGTTNSRRAEATWYDFVQGPASFFMMDTRSYRSQNSVPFEEEDKTMLGPDQLADFLAWLARPEPSGVRWKVISSSIPFTKNWPVNVRDTWGGFLVERKQVLEAMWDASSQGVGIIILSGDRHEAGITAFPPPKDSKWSDLPTVHEFSTSPLNQFASPIPSYHQKDDEDVKIAYYHSGISKFGSFTIEDIEGESTLLYRLFINGDETWNTTVKAPPLPKAEKPQGSFWDRLRFI